MELILKQDVENLGFKDGFFQNDEEHQLEVIKIIRKYKPKIVLCNAKDDRHIDHPKGADLVSDACFLSGLEKIKTKLEYEFYTLDEAIENTSKFILKTYC